MRMSSQAASSVAPAEPRWATVDKAAGCGAGGSTWPTGPVRCYSCDSSTSAVASWGGATAMKKIPRLINCRRHSCRPVRDRASLSVANLNNATIWAESAERYYACGCSRCAGLSDSVAESSSDVGMLRLARWPSCSGARVQNLRCWTSWRQTIVFHQFAEWCAIEATTGFRMNHGGAESYLQLSLSLAGNVSYFSSSALNC